MKLLLEILSMKRPHGGAGERYVAEEILTRLPGELDVFSDLLGEPMAYVYTTDPKSQSLFVAHLDTMHREDGDNPVVYDMEKDALYKTDGTRLGADDAAGCWLLYKMAEARVPGKYLFTVGEERGGVGAKWLADNAAEWLSGFDRAIAFDRKGTSSVITHQAWGRCCSDEFATALALGLSTTMPHEFKPDSGGIYTDTAEFTELVSECTNISVGYHKEHTALETLDVAYLKNLLAGCLLVDWEGLPTKRDSTKVEDIWDRWGFEDRPCADLGAVMAMDDEGIYDWVYSNPEEAAELIISMKEV